MNFDEYLKAELAKKNTNDDYDPDGNSNRAVVTRGLWREILWQYKAYPKRIRVELRCFDGLSTELGWFIQVPIMLLFSPVLPIIAARHWYNRSVGEYKSKWHRSQNKDY
ncbi:MAG: hypothetical protein GY787_18465 [Alteromonadales bacterium]|nr:hypothetical protein [Alteromonadales bacterium]